MEDIEAIVVGAGVVGLACARALTRAGRDVIIIERHESIGQENSSRNSEVIHSGIYYPQGSLKAKLCVEGRELLTDFCKDYYVHHKLCGKLIVATTKEQESKLEQINDLAKNNGVTNLRYLSASQAKNVEPFLTCNSALLSPSSGILSSHDYMLALLGDAENYGARLALKTDFRAAEIKNSHIIVSVGSNPTTKIRTQILINSGGLSATRIAKNIMGFAQHNIPKTYFAKGNYFSLSSKAPFSHLIYPIPEPGGLGVHLTLDLGGQARFGPDVEWVDEINFDVIPKRSEDFYAVIRTYWPELKDDTLKPAYSGIRPKITSPGEPDADFIIQDMNIHGIPGLINLFGIESPGLTSSLAIAKAVMKLLNM